MSNNNNQNNNQKKGNRFTTDPLKIVERELEKKKNQIKSTSTSLAKTKKEAVELTKNYRKLKDSTPQKSAAFLPVMVVGIFYIILGIILGQPPKDNFSDLMWPLIVMGGLLQVPTYYLHKLKVKGYFMVILLITFLTSSYIIHVLPFGDVPQTPKRVIDYSKDHY